MVDGNIWTSSGVSAGASSDPAFFFQEVTETGVIIGTDMAVAFLEVLAGKEFAEFSRVGLEVATRNQGDDEFAAVYGLV